MAEYRSLAQNTYKFTMEVTLNHVGEIGEGMVYNYPRIKYVTADNSRLQYLALVAGHELTSATSTELKGQMFVGSTSTSSTPTIETFTAAYDSYYVPATIVAVAVEGKAYYGQKSAHYNAAPMVFARATSKGGTATIVAGEAGYIPGGKIKTVIYSVAANTIVVNEVQQDAVMLEGSYTVSTYAQIGIAPALVVAKEANDIVLAIEVEYPKHDITVNNRASGVQYSFDGEIFQDVPETLDLSQVEHIIVKNTGDAEIYIGTNDGGAQIATIAAGATRVIIPDMDVECYIS